MQDEWLHIYEIIFYKFDSILDAIKMIYFEKKKNLNIYDSYYKTSKECNIIKQECLSTQLCNYSIKCTSCI